MVLIRRESYFDKINAVIDSDFVKVFIGIRRSGKTELMISTIDELKKRGVSEDNIIYISLEDRKYYDITDYMMLDDVIFNLADNIKGRLYIFIDEIQQVKQWEKVLTLIEKHLIVIFILRGLMLSYCLQSCPLILQADM